MALQRSSLQSNIVHKMYSLQNATSKQSGQNLELISATFRVKSSIIHVKKVVKNKKKGT